jgi:hypothetical protein
MINASKTIIGAKTTSAMIATLISNARTSTGIRFAVPAW